MRRPDPHPNLPPARGKESVHSNLIALNMKIGACGSTSTASDATGQRGFSLLEFCIVVVVLSVVLVCFFDRVQMYQEMAEKTAAEVTAVNMRTGLRYRVAEMLLHHQEREIGGLVGSNPIKWLDLPLQNYAGEFGPDQSAQVAPGSWYFNLDKGEM